MTNILTFYFKGSDMQRLVKPDTGYVLVTSAIEVKEIDGVKVGVVVVSASSFKRGASPADLPTADETIPGCPVPPCVGGDGLLSSDCNEEAENLIASYTQNNLR